MVEYLFLLIISILVTWSIGLIPPLLIRFLLVRKPINKFWAIITVGIFWIINLAIFILLDSKSKSHGALVLIMFVSYSILTSGLASKAKNNTNIEQKTETVNE